jgi:tetratricopeptide (TPR) repeat protein
MRLRSEVTRWVCILLVVNCLALPRASSQHSTPIKKKGLIDALSIGGLTPAELAKMIDDRGVDFRLTYDNEEELRKAGASPPILDAARKHYRHAPTAPADRANAANLVKSSRALFDAHDPSSALPVVSQALEIDPDNADAYVLRARLYFASGEAERGVADANIALQIQPANGDARRLLQSGGKADVAVASPNTGVAEVPAAGRQGFLGCRLRQQSGQYVVIGTMPSGSAARGGVLPGDVALSANGLSFKDFYEQYLTPGKITPGETINVQVQRQGQTLGLQLVALPRPNPGDEALAYFGQLIQQFPGNPEAYLYRAGTYVQLKNLPAALADTNMFVRLDPGDPSGYELRARIKTAMGDAQGGKADQDALARLNQAASAPATPSPANPPAYNAPGNNVPAAPVAFPARWTLLQFNQAYQVTLNGDHLYFQGVGLSSTGEAGKTTDKKGSVVYKGKWRQKNANGTLSEWNFVLKTVTPDRMEGTVYTMVFTGEAVTFIPQK